jgi:hypothetical protein
MPSIKMAVTEWSTDRRGIRCRTIYAIDDPIDATAGAG